MLSSAILEPLESDVSYAALVKDAQCKRDVRNACGMVQFAAMQSPLCVMYGSSVQRHARSVGSHCDFGTVAATHAVCVVIVSITERSLNYGP